MSTDINSGPGWYEVIHPSTATTEIVRVMEDGSIYCPEGVITRGEFLYAAARGNAHRLIRADDPEERVVAEEPEGEHVFIERYGMYHAKFGGIGGDVTSLGITREAWKAMGEPNVLAVSWVPVEQEPDQTTEHEIRRQP